MADHGPRFRLQPGERLLNWTIVWWGTNPTGNVTRGGTLYATDRRLALGRRNILGTIITFVIGLPLLIISASYASWVGPMLIVAFYYAWHLFKPRIRWLAGQRISHEAALTDVVEFRLEKQPGFSSQDTVALTMRTGERWRLAPSGKSSAEGIARGLRLVLKRDPETAPR